MKRPNLKVRQYNHSATRRFLLDLRPWGKGRLFFPTKAEAEAERLRQLTALQQHGREAMGLPQHEISDFIKTRKRLADYGKTIVDAADFLIQHLEKVRRVRTTVSELADQVLEAKRRAGLSPTYLADLRKRLRRFSQDFGSQPIASVTVEQVDNWLNTLPLSPKSRANFRANVGVLFSYAAKRRLIDHNPILYTETPKLVDKRPDIFTIDELRLLLEAAQSIQPDVLPALAIGAFAGLRDAEIKRLDWSEVGGRAPGFVEVTAAKAKSAQRRLIPIQPNFAEWLRPYGGLTGRVVPDSYRGKRERVLKEAGISWKQNALRHSFASYRLAATNNAAQVALELGHTSTKMLFSNYREIVRPDEAARYWDIKPAAETANLVVFTRKCEAAVAIK